MIDITKSTFIHNDGMTAPWCGIDFANGKAETVFYKSRKGRIVARYSLPDDPHLRSYRDWFDEHLYKRLDEFLAKRVKEIEADIFAWIKRNPICYMNPCEALLDRIYGVMTPATFPRGNICAERYEVTEFFLQFPLALPTELKGIAV